MPVEFVEGDLFVNRYNAAALGHGCNCKGVMGSGIAVQFKQRYRPMFDAYRNMCKAEPRQFNPGDAFLWQDKRDDTKPYVFNLATQDGYIGFRPAKIEWVRAALESMRRQADEAGITTIAIPAIGAGLGGLKWADVSLAIEDTFADWDGTLYVYAKYVKGQ